MAPGRGPFAFSVSLFLFLFFSLFILDLSYAQSSTPSSSGSGSSSSGSASPSQSTSSPSGSLSLTTTTVTSVFSTHSGSTNLTSTSVFPSIFNVTVTPTPTSSTSTNTTAPTASPSVDPTVLNTKIDPGFGVLGALLIITGLPSAFLGHKNRWSSFFIIGFYTLALVCLALIVKFGVLSAINPPNETLKGVFVLACSVAGVAGGGVAIFFWRQTKYFIGAWGGFSIGLWVQAFRNGGLIRPIGLRWILYIGVGVVGFCVCTIPKAHYPTLLISTAAVGATAFILGVDCYTTAGLKEFYVWNLGFDSLFTRYVQDGIHFPVTQMMQVELGLIGAVALMGAAVQLRILKVLQIKLKEITLEQKKRDEELEAQATNRFEGTLRELETWEKEHGRNHSGFSSMPLMKDQELNTPATEDMSTFTLVGGRQRRQSNLSEFKAQPRDFLEDEFGQPRDRRQSIGALPALDLGVNLESDIPRGFVDESKPSTPPETERDVSSHSQEEIKRKEGLLAEINEIRRSIEVLRSETPGSSHHSEMGAVRSRHQSFTSRRTLSQDLAAVLDEPRARPPRTSARARVQSMDYFSAVPGIPDETHSRSPSVGASISRPTSAPLLQEDWDTYVRERKLYQPPSGVTPPIGTVSPRPKRASQLMPVSPAVEDALVRRQKNENAIDLGEFGQLGQSSKQNPSPMLHESSSDSQQSHARPVVKQSRHSGLPAGATAPNLLVLPPRKKPTNEVSQQKPQATTRTLTFEELTERHREKMRSLQAPLSRAEQEQADLESAKNRWERSKAMEKQAMIKREAEKAQAAASKSANKANEPKDKKGSKSSGQKGDPKQGAPTGHTRSLSADQLARLPGANSSSKRQSMMKVEGWQRFQQNQDHLTTSKPEAASSSKRDSRLPFPISSQPNQQQSSRAKQGDEERRRSSRMMG